MIKLRFALIFSLLLLLSSVAVLHAAAPAKLTPNCEWFTCDLQTEVFNKGGFVDNILTWIVSISLSAATIAIVWAGILLAFYSDNEGKRKEAKEIFKLVGKGLIFVLAAYVIIKTILSFFAVGSQFNPLS